MTKPLKKPQLQAASEKWLNAVVDYKVQGGYLVMTLRIKGKRVRFQLRPDGVWRRRIKRKGSNHWHMATAWDALQCRLSYNSYRSVFKKAPAVMLSD